MSISFSGLASGLDTSSWVESLVALKRAKVTTLESQKTTIELTKDTLDSIKSFFSSFRATLEKVTDARLFSGSSSDIFIQNLATSSNSDILSAVAQPNAKEATYNILVEKLATNTEVSSRYVTTYQRTTTADNSSKLTEFALGINIKDEGSTIGIRVDGIERCINLTKTDTIATLVKKLNDIGVEAYYNENSGIFSVNIDDDAINDDYDHTGIKAALNLTGVNEGYLSNQIQLSETETLYSAANGSTTLGDLGFNTSGNLYINANDKQYTISVSQTTSMEDFIQALRDNNINAELDATGVFTIDDAEFVTTGAEGTVGEALCEAFGLEVDIFESTQSTNRLTHSVLVTSVTVAGTDTLIKDLGEGVTINASNETLTIINSDNETTTFTITDETKIGDMLEAIQNAGLSASISSDGQIEISGGIISGGILEALGLEEEPFSAMVTGNALTETIIVHKTATLETTLVDDLKVTEGYLKVTKPDGTDFYEKIYSGQTIAMFMADMGNLGISTSLDEDTGVLTITGGAFETLSDSDVEYLISQGKIVETDDRYKHGTNLLECLYGAPEISMLHTSVSSTRAKSMALRQSETTTCDADIDTTLGTLGLSENGTAVFNVRGDERTINVTTDTTLDDLITLLSEEGISASFDEDTHRFSLENATITGGTSNLSSILGMTTSVSGKYKTSNELFAQETITIDATRDTVLKDFGILNSMSNPEKTVVLRNSDGTTIGSTVVSESTSVGDLLDFITSNGKSASINEGVITIHDAYIENTTLETAMGLEHSNLSSYVLGSIMTHTTVVAVTQDTTLGNIFDTIGTTEQVAGGYNLYFNSEELSVSADTTINDLIAQVYAKGGTASIDSIGRLTIDGGTLTGSVADALGIVSVTNTASVEATGNDIYTTTVVAADLNTKLADLGLDTSSVVVHNTLGAEVTTLEFTGENTISDVFNALSSNGINGIISNGVITLLSQDENYITGNLAEAFGITTQTVTAVANTTSYSTLSVTHTGTVTATLSTTLGEVNGVTAENQTFEIYREDGFCIATISDLTTSSTIGDMFARMEAYGIQGSINNGVINLFSPSGNYAEGTIMTNLGISRLDGVSRTYTIAKTTTTSTPITFTNTVSASQSDKISDFITLPVDTAVTVFDSDHNSLGTINITADTTFESLFSNLSSYGIIGSIHDGVINFTPTNGQYATGDVLTSLGIDTTSTVITTTAGTTNTGTVISYTTTHIASGSTSLGTVGINSTSSITVKDSATGAILGSFNVTGSTTFNELSQSLDAYGITLSIVDGVLHMNSDSAYIESDGLSGLGISTSTTTTTISTTVGASVTATAAVTYTQTTTATGATTLGDINIAAGSITIRNAETGQIITSFDVDTTTSLNSLINTLDDYGINASVIDGIFRVASGDAYAEGAPLTELGIGTETITTTVSTIVTTAGNDCFGISTTYSYYTYATENTKISETGLNAVGTVTIYNAFNGTSVATFTTDADTTFLDLANSLGTYGISAGITDGVFFLSSDNTYAVGGVLNELGVGIESQTLTGTTSTTTVGRTATGTRGVRMLYAMPKAMTGTSTLMVDATVPIEHTGSTGVSVTYSTTITNPIATTGLNDFNTTVTQTTTVTVGQATTSSGTYMNTVTQTTTSTQTLSNTIYQGLSQNGNVAYMKTVTQTATGTAAVSVVVTTTASATASTVISSPTTGSITVTVTTTATASYSKTKTVTVTATALATSSDTLSDCGVTITPGTYFYGQEIDSDWTISNVVSIMGAAFYHASFDDGKIVVWINEGDSSFVTEHANFISDLGFTAQGTDPGHYVFVSDTLTKSAKLKKTVTVAGTTTKTVSATETVAVSGSGSATVNITTTVYATATVNQTRTISASVTHTDPYGGSDTIKDIFNIPPGTNYVTLVIGGSNADPVAHGGTGALATISISSTSTWVDAQSTLSTYGINMFFDSGGHVVLQPSSNNDVYIANATGTYNWLTSAGLQFGENNTYEKITIAQTVTQTTTTTYTEPASLNSLATYKDGNFTVILGNTDSNSTVNIVVTSSSNNNLQLLADSLASYDIGVQIDSDGHIIVTPTGDYYIKDVNGGSYGSKVKAYFGWSTGETTGTNAHLHTVTQSSSTTVGQAVTGTVSHSETIILDSTTVVSSSSTESLVLPNGTIASGNNTFEEIGVTPGFIEYIDRVNTDSLTALSDVTGVITTVGTYKISTTADLLALAQRVNHTVTYTICNGCTFVLANDINMGGSVVNIGTSSRAFSGTFDGNGYIISNYGNGEGALFDQISYATIKNLGTENFNVGDEDNAGGIVNDTQGGDCYLYNCYVAGGSIGSDNAAGGLLGRAFATVGYGTKIESCALYNNTVYGGGYVGGIVGEVRSKTTISNCLVNNYTSSSYNQGGVVGQASGTGTLTIESTSDYGIMNTNDSNFLYQGGIIGSCVGTTVYLDEVNSFGSFAGNTQNSTRKVFIGNNYSSNINATDCCYKSTQVSSQGATLDIPGATAISAPTQPNYSDYLPIVVNNNGTLSTVHACATAPLDEFVNVFNYNVNGITASYDSTTGIFTISGDLNNYVEYMDPRIEQVLKLGSYQTIIQNTTSTTLMDFTQTFSELGGPGYAYYSSATITIASTSTGEFQTITFTYGNTLGDVRDLLDDYDIDTTITNEGKLSFSPTGDWYIRGATPAFATLFGMSFGENNSYSIIGGGESTHTELMSLTDINLYTANDGMAFTVVVGSSDSDVTHDVVVDASYRSLQDLKDALAAYDINISLNQNGYIEVGPQGDYYITEFKSSNGQIANLALAEFGWAPGSDSYRTEERSVTHVEPDWSYVDSSSTFAQKFGSWIDSTVTLLNTSTGATATLGVNGDTVIHDFFMNSLGDVYDIDTYMSDLGEVILIPRGNWCITGCSPGSFLSVYGFTFGLGASRSYITDTVTTTEAVNLSTDVTKVAGFTGGNVVLQNITTGATTTVAYSASGTFGDIASSLASNGITMSFDQDGHLVMTPTGANYISSVTGGLASVFGFDTGINKTYREIDTDFDMSTPLTSVGLSGTTNYYITLTNDTTNQTTSVYVQGSETLTTLQNRLNPYNIELNTGDNGNLVISATGDWYISGIDSTLAATFGLSVGEGDSFTYMTWTDSDRTLNQLTGANLNTEQYMTIVDSETGVESVVTITGSDTISDLDGMLEEYGLSAYTSVQNDGNGYLTLFTRGKHYIKSMPAILANAFQINAGEGNTFWTVEHEDPEITITSNTTSSSVLTHQISGTLNGSTTFGQLGLAVNKSVYIKDASDNTVATVAVNTDTTVNDFLTSVAGFGISGSISADGQMSLTFADEYYFAQNEGTETVGGFINPVTRTSEADALAAGYTCVHNAAELQSALSTNNDVANAKIMLMSDIDLTDVAWSNYTLGSNAIFDGNGYTVANLTYIQSDLITVGFFSRMKTGSQVKNLTLSNIDLTANCLYNQSKTGIIAGYCMSDASIDNCVILDSHITANDGDAGGIIGQAASNVTIQNVYADVDIDVTSVNNKANKYFGGAIGYILSGQNVAITNCELNVDIDTSAVTAGTKYIGNFIGSGSAGSDSYVLATITDSNAYGTITFGAYGRPGSLMGNRLSGKLSTSGDVTCYSMFANYAYSGSGTALQGDGYASNDGVVPNLPPDYSTTQTVLGLLGITNYGTTTSTVYDTHTETVNTSGDTVRSYDATITMGWDTTFFDLGMSENSSENIILSNNGQLATIIVSSSNSISDIAQELALYNISTSITDGVTTLGAGSNWSITTPGPLSTYLNLSNTASDYYTIGTTTTTVGVNHTDGRTFTSTSTDPMTGSTTFAQLGMNMNAVIGINDATDTTVATVTVSPDMTVTDFLTSVAGYGISGSISPTGQLTFTFADEYYFAENAGGVTPGGVDGFLRPITRTSEADAIAAGYTCVHDAEELKNAFTTNKTKIMLMNDIDLEGVEWGDYDLKGTFDGNGYTISNLTYTSNANAVGFISTANNWGAQIRNLAISNFDITASHRNNEANLAYKARSGILVGFMQHGAQINNCVILDSTLTADSEYAGGVVGHLGGTENQVKNVYADAEIIISRDITTTAGQLCGIIYGYNNTIKNCILDVDIDASAMVSNGNSYYTGFANFVGNNESFGNNSNTVKDSHTYGTIISKPTNARFQDLIVFSGDVTCASLGNSPAGVTLNDGIMPPLPSSTMSTESFLSLIGISGGSPITTYETTIKQNTTSALQQHVVVTSMNSDTTFAELGLESDSYVTVDQNGTTFTITVQPSQTVGEFLSALAGYGVSGSVTDGAISFLGGTNSYISGMTTELQNALDIGLGNNTSWEVGTITTSVNTDSRELNCEKNTLLIDGTTRLNTINDWNNGNGNLVVHKTNGQLQTISVNETGTLNDFFRQIAQFGLVGTVGDDGKVTILGAGNVYLQSEEGGSNILSALKMSNVTTQTQTITSNSTSSPLTHTVTVAASGTTTLEHLESALGAALEFNGNTVSMVLSTTSDAGNQSLTLTFNKNNTVYDVISALSAHGISAQIDALGRFSMGSSTLNDFTVTGTLAEFLMGDYTKQYGTDTTYNVSTNLMQKTVVNMTNDTLLSELNVTSGDFEVTQQGVKYTLSISNTNTVGDFRNLLAQYGINTFIDDEGHLSAYGVGESWLDSVAEGSNIVTQFGLDKNNWTLGEITQTSDDLNDTSIITDKTTWDRKLSELTDNTGASLGISSGNIFVYQDGTRSTLYVDNNDTLETFAAKLSQYGITMGLSSDGKIYFDGTNDSYITAASSNPSNILTQIGAAEDWSVRYDSESQNLNYEVTNNTKMKRSTKLVDLLDEDGENIGITTGTYYIYEDGVRNTETITEDTTVNDLMASMARYGLIADVAEDGSISVSGHKNSYIQTSSLMGSNSNLLESLFNSTWEFTNIYTSNNLEPPKPEIRAITRDTKFADIAEGTYQAGNVTVTKDGIQSNIVLNENDTVGTFMDQLAMYGFDAVINDNGQLILRASGDSNLSAGSVLDGYSNALSILGVELANWVQTNNYDGTELNVTKYSTATVSVTRDTALSEIKADDSNFVSTGEFNIYKDGVKYTALISSDETVGSLMDKLQTFGLGSSLVDGKIELVSSGDAYIAASTSTTNASNVYKLFVNQNHTNTYSGLEQTTSTTVHWHNATEETLVSELQDQWGETVAGSLTVDINGVKNTIEIAENDSIGDILDKFRVLGLEATISNGRIMVQSGYDTLSIDTTASTSSLSSGANTRLLFMTDLGVSDGVRGYAASSSAVKVINNITENISASKFADKNTNVGLLNISNGTFSLYRDGMKATVNIDENDTLASEDPLISSLQKKINNALTAKGAVGDIVLNFDERGFLTFSSSGGAEVTAGSSTDTSNIFSVLGLESDGSGNVRTARELYCVNNESKITTSGIFREGNVTEGTFIIGDAQITIDSNTTLSDIVAQINGNTASNAYAYWDNIKGTLVITSNSTGSSFVNIEAGTSNFTDILGYTQTERNVDGSIKSFSSYDHTNDLGAVETYYTANNSKIITDTQAIGGNAKFSINGTTYTSASNVISSDISRIQGVTINLKNISEGEKVTLKVEKDKELVTNAVADVVDSYNELMEELDNQLASDDQLKKDVVLKSLRTQLKSAMSKSINSIYGLKNINQLGISTAAAKSGNISTSFGDIVTLTFDKEKFAKEFLADPIGTKTLLAGSDSIVGVFSEVENVVKTAIESSTGYFTTAEKSYNQQISNINQKIKRENTSLERYREMLENKFRSMDMLIAQMNQQYNSFLNS